MQKTIKTIACANELAVTPEDPATFRIPFKVYPFGYKTIRNDAGDPVRVHVDQLFDAAGAKSCLALVEEAAKEGPGTPVYFGHPDSEDYAAKYPDKAAKGWIKTGRLEDGALVLDVTWLQSPHGGFGWFSPLFVGALSVDGDTGNATMAVSQIKSIGLVNNPNIIDFRLANEAPEENTNPNPGGDAGQKKDNTNMDWKKKLIDLLKLDPAATDEQIAAALSKLQTDAAAAATKCEAAEATANECKKESDKAKAELANERAAHVGLLLDGAIADGRITPAGKAAWEKRLAEDFEHGRIELANEKPALKTGSAANGLKARPEAEAGKIVELANERRQKTGCSFDDAYAWVKAHPQK